MQIGWNKRYLSEVDKHEFLKDHQHLKDHADLEKVWEDAQTNKPVTEKKKSK